MKQICLEKNQAGESPPWRSWWPWPGISNYSGMRVGKETATLGKVQEGAADEGAVSTSLIDIPSLDEDVSVEETGEIQRRFRRSGGGDRGWRRNR